MLTFSFTLMLLSSWLCSNLILPLAFVKHIFLTCFYLITSSYCFFFLSCLVYFLLSLSFRFFLINIDIYFMFSLNLIFSFAIFKDIFQQLVLYYNESSMCQRSLKNSGRLMSFHCYCKMCKTTKSTPLSVSKRLTGTVLLLFLKFLLAYCFCYFIGI